MSIQRTKLGKWQADVNVGGRLAGGGKRIRKIFRTQKEASNFESSVRGNHAQGRAWGFAYKQQDYRLSELCETWHQIHGQNLKRGTERLRTLHKVCDELGNPWLSEFSRQDFMTYRSNNKRVSASTLNHYHAYLSAVFNELIRIDQIKTNPLDKLKCLKVKPTELSYLEKDEIEILLSALKPKKSDTYMVTKICLSTGTRWREACGIKCKNVSNNQIHVLGKNGKIRHLSITPALAKEIKDKAPFANSYNVFRRTLKKLGLKKSDFQLTHLLRHTFASHCMMNGGNILALQKILDHSSLNMTMRYAHLSPNHLQDMTQLNPIDF
jgi:integrase